MPELPEVEITIRSLRNQIINQKITKIEVFYEPIVKSISIFQQLLHQTFYRCERKGKFLLFFFSNEWVLVGHLRMEGKIYLHSISQCNHVQDKHEHFRIFLSNNFVFRFYDFRKFARFNLYKEDNYLKESKLYQLALDPFSISIETFYQKLQKSTSNIKQALLNQKIISGIGNIYASEILFLAKIHPEVKANILKLEKVQDLLNKTKKVLTKAIAAGGSSISTFEALGVKGNFQKQLLVYGKAKQKCSFCPKLIQNIKINGRSSYFCYNCQKL